MDHGIEIGANYTRTQIVDAMVDEALRLGVSEACVRRARDGIVILIRGQLEHVRMGKGASSFVRADALARIVELVGDKAA